jgi:membrane protein implicated in regulation of membrane protease activity
VSFATGATLAAILAIVSTHFLAFVVALLAGLTTAIGAAWLSRRPTERSSGRTTSDAAELDVRRPNGGIR